MTRNGNLELNLFPFSNPDHRHQSRPSLPSDESILQQQEEVHSDESILQQQEVQQQQQLTIFYNGRVCVCDVTELQAKAILLLARREKEDKMSSPTTTGSEPGSPTLSSPIYSPNGLSMKRSLQRFLQKRNHRIQSTYPYIVNGHACTLHH